MKTNLQTAIATFILVVTTCISFTGNAQTFVNAAATGANNGTSWANAYTSLETALANTTSGEIRVASGTYKPGTLETDSFIIPENITLLGGFNGTETMASERNWATNPTILSGDINNSNTPNAGDSHSIMTITSSNITINGFIFENSYADAATTLADRSGAAVFISNTTSPSNLQFINTIFRNNHAVGTGANGVGGAIISYGNNHSYTNCLFYNNVASSSGGVLSPQIGNNLKITNCTFAKNNATTEGGAIHFNSTSAAIVNSVFAENTGGTNPDINNHSGSAVSLSYSALNQAALTPGAGGGTITIGSDNVDTTTPLFTNAAANDFSLQLTSPLVDVGNNTANTQTKDLAGNIRIINSTIDIGAYERNLCAGLGSIVYVNAAATTGANNGTSWNDAFTDLQAALDIVTTCTIVTEIHVAGGTTYKPSTAQDCTGCTAADPRENYFLIKNNIILKGSYTAGTTTQDYSNPTILSGDINGDDTITGSGATLSITNNADNVYNVVITTGLNSTALIDGVTITGGNANRSIDRTVNSKMIFKESGGGMYNTSSPSLSNTTFSGNSSGLNGGGMYNGLSSSPSLTNTTFSGNSSSTAGGGMYNRDSSPNLTNTTFSGNFATSFGGGMNSYMSSPSLSNTTFSGNSTGTSGGGMSNFNSSPSLTNTNFSGNSAGSDGGGMFNRLSSPSLSNTTFSGNSAGDGGGMFNSVSSPTLYNTVLYGNGTDIFNDGSSSINTASTHNYSQNFTQAGFTALTADPFTNSADPDGADNLFGTPDDGLFPAVGSPLINAGDNSKNTQTTDITGQARKVGTIDIGAYERNLCAGLGSIVYVNAAATTGANNGTSWNDAFTDLQAALDIVTTCTIVTEIHVAGGTTYKPSTAQDCTGCTAADPRENYFLIKNNIILKGSYTAGTTTQDYSNPTILSGDINGDDTISGSGATLTITNSTENVYNVVITIGLNNTALIDGVTITGGNSNGSGSRTVNSRTIFKESGGGMHNIASSPSLTNITFSGNFASDTGGGMYNDSSSPSLSNTTFSGNSATIGGGMYNNDSSPSLTNTTFSGNLATFGGGGMYNATSSPSLTNTTLSGNSATVDGGGMYNDFSSLILFNTVLYGNGTDIFNEGGSTINTASTHNYSQNFTQTGFTTLTADPFTNSADPDGADNLFGTADDGLFPAVGSPLINAGDNTKNTQTTDLAGQARIINSTIDVGAYEFDPSALSVTDFRTTTTIKAYPNPVNGILTLKGTDAAFKYEVFNMQGRRLGGSDSGVSKTIDFSNYPSGLYLIKVLTETGVDMIKVIKE